ncbi:MAG: metalloregulator ArsR/SmtB family transcription factor [Anaerolineales bacterium]
MTLVADTDHTLQALADPTRREILDLLLQHGAMRAGDLADQFDEISRPAVSRHLRRLREADLVNVRRHGRQRWYSLDPAPLELLYQDWLSHYEALWDDRLQRLKEAAETDKMGAEGDV